MALRRRAAAAPLDFRFHRPDALAKLCRYLSLALLCLAAFADHLLRALRPVLVVLAAGRFRERKTGCATAGSRGVKPKPPRVASIVVAETREERISWARIADLIVWCGQAGMRYVFVYDPRGLAKENPEGIAGALKIANKQGGWDIRWTFGWDTHQSILKPDGVFIAQNGQSIDKELRDHGKQHVIPQDHLVLHILSRQDSVAPVLKAVMHSRSASEDAPPLCDSADSLELPHRAEASIGYCLHVRADSNNALLQQPQDRSMGSGHTEDAAALPSQVCLEETSPKTVQHSNSSTNAPRSALKPHLLRSQIQETVCESAVLEPEIMFVVGGALSLSGCPPWHARFSEIYYLGALTGITKKNFESALSRYMGTEQRFGV
ncbi:unnamed protein product [Ostreobium quekettii]|uniref:ditrans,polycis-polyprenyl diphosphate synthase [(2E,6E)-farnesyldiphosphate specific] n=1 Tax=Ostreobium quekettii TaxID=121088 RepID=A0A8S1IYM1_9CHLO|nr:unnamed protein product [Ostreobium quekettii]|eukprot:evm.model.scf_972.8 EVM.evm.TU.scf_972.8   scf_972:51213-53519(+)